MKIFFFILASFFSFTASATYTQWPTNCLKKEIFPCVIHAYKKSQINYSENKFFISKDSLLDFKSSKEFTLYQGVALVNHAEKLKVDLRYAASQATQDKGELLVVAQGDSWSFRCIAGSYNIRSRGNAEDEYQLQAGNEISMGPVSYERKSTFLGLPTVIDLKKYLKSVGAVFPFEELNFQEHVDNVAKVLQKASWRQAQWNKTIVERKIAQTEESQIRQKYEAEYAKKREEYLRRLFRQKNNFEEE